MPSVEVRGRELYVERRGAGEPLLLIMGLSGTHRSWGDGFLDLLAPGFELIVYDHRGIGLSGPLDGPFTIADLAHDAAGLLDAIGIGETHVMGISMGGMVAQELALATPGRVRTLTLGCTYAGGPQGVITDRATITRMLAATASGDRELQLRTAWEVNVAPAFAADESAYAAFRERALAAPAPPAVVLEQLKATAVHDASARLADIAAPTLVVHGDLDAMLGVANGRAIAAAIPGSRLEILEGVGHLFWIERPETAAALVHEHARSGAPIADQ